jgi:hypothetical protein
MQNSEICSRVMPDPNLYDENTRVLLIVNFSNRVAG